MSRVMGASGAESLNVAASIFMGQTEAPLTIRPFLPRMTRSELMTVMTSGMAHISGSIMVAYIAFGIEARHLLTAVIMTAPGTIMMSKLFEPETEVPETYGTVSIDMPKQDVNLLDAAARGHQRGAAADAQRDRDAGVVRRAGGAAQRRLRGGAPLCSSGSPPTCRRVLGWIFRPIAWAMGVPWHDSGTIGSLLGTRMVLNEFIAFAQLGPMKAQLDPRSFTIASFALAGFANFSSVGIQLGGIGALAPERKKRPRAARPPRHARRHARQFPLRHDRGDPAVTATQTADAPAPDATAMVDEAADAVRARLGGRTPTVGHRPGLGPGPVRRAADGRGADPVRARSRISQRRR